MLKDLAWDFFEKTGSVDAFLEYRQMSAGKAVEGCVGNKTDGGNRADN